MEEMNPFIGGVVESVVGCEQGSDEMRITMEGGRWLLFDHEQNCCEDVRINDVIGDVADLVGQQLTMCEVVSSEEGPVPEFHDSYTWTFYKFASPKGFVTVRWLGASNGYYSEEVRVTAGPVTE